MRIFWIFVLFVSLFSSDLFANNLGKCKTFNVKKEYIYEIKSALYKGTHIQLPENIAQAPVIANDLWEVDGKFSNIFVQPTSSEPEGKTGHLVVIGELNTYHFRLTCVKNKPDQCVILKNKQSVFQNSSFSGTSAGTPLKIQNNQLMASLKSLRGQLRTLKNSHHENVGDALKKYRAFVYTRYKWSKGTGFKGHHLVTDVFDDGRFTYIRLKSDNRGHLAVSANMDGQKEMIHYVIDSPDVYKIVGIFPKLTLKYGKSHVTIKRKDKFSNGSY